MYFAVDSAIGATGYRIFKDMLNRTFYKRINKNATTELTQDLIDAQRDLNPILVESVITEQALTIVDVQKVLKLLLEEQVPIRNLQLILETLADHGRDTKDATDLTIAVRQTLRREIINSYVTESGSLAVVMLSPSLQQTLNQFDNTLLARFS